MTRAAHRILNRARSSAWRRVGMPINWAPPAPSEPEATAAMSAPNEDETTGKNVAAGSVEPAGTGRQTDETSNLNGYKTKS